MPAVFDKRWKRGAFLALLFLTIVTAAALIDRRAQRELSQKLERDLELLHDELEGFPVGQTPTMVNAKLRALGIDTGPLSTTATDVRFTVEEHSWWRYGCISVALSEDEPVHTSVSQGKCDEGAPS